MKAKLLLITMGFMFAAASVTGQQKFEASYDKQFVTDVDPDASLKFESFHGNVNLYEWEDPQIKITARVKARSTSQKQADQNLANVELKFEKIGNTVYYKTVIGEMKGKGNHASVELNVYVPAGTTLDISQKYGNVNADMITGKFTGNISYGNLNTGDITHDRSRIRMAYGNGKIASAKELILKMAYGNFNADKVGSIDIESSYSNLNFDSVGSAELDSKYDKITIREIGELSVSDARSTLTINRLAGSVEIANLKYGGLKIRKAMKDFDLINITAEYSNVEIGFDQDASFSLDASARYGGIELGSLPTDMIESSRRGSTQVNYTGYVGGISDSKVILKTDYGNINLRKSNR